MRCNGRMTDQVQMPCRCGRRDRTQDMREEVREEFGYGDAPAWNKSKAKRKKVLYK